MKKKSAHSKQPAAREQCQMVLRDEDIEKLQQSNAEVYFSDNPNNKYIVRVVDKYGVDPSNLVALVKVNATFPSAMVLEFSGKRDANGELLYDPSYEGIDDAIRFFNRAYAHFYALLQDEHVEYLNYVLELVAATDSYVEKVGMIALIERYIDTNDLDTSDARINVILSNVDICKSELEARGEDYSKVLKQNSVYFVNLVENMRTAKSYAEQVAYYEAASVLYFSLDITVEGSAEAVEIFDQYKAKLDLIEESSVKFLQAVSLYNACEDKDEKYAALVECYYNAQFAELTYEGVAEAMTEYQAAYDAYVSYANAVNADLAETGNAVGSVRTTCGVTTVIAIIIKKIFGI